MRAIATDGVAWCITVSPANTAELNDYCNAVLHGAPSYSIKKLHRVQNNAARIVQSPQHLDAVVPAIPNPGSRTRPQPAIDHYDAVSINLSQRQHLRNALFDALHQLSGTHYRKLFSVVTLLTHFLSLG